MIGCNLKAATTSDILNIILVITIRIGEDGSSFRFTIVEQCGSLLQCPIFGLDDGIVKEDDLKGKEGDVNEVIPPTQHVESESVDVLIDDDREGYDEVEGGKTLGSQLVGQNLEGVGNDQRAEGQVVRSEE